MTKKELLSKTKKLTKKYVSIICPNWIVTADTGNLGYPNPRAMSIARVDERLAHVIVDYQAKEEELDHLVVHELLHVILEPLQRFIEVLKKERCTEAESTIINNLYQTILENTIEDLVKTIMKLKGIKYGTHLNIANYYCK